MCLAWQQPFQGSHRVSHPDKLDFLLPGLDRYLLNQSTYPLLYFLYETVISHV